MTQPVDDSYPAEWFPQVSRVNAEREGQQIINDLQELPTGVIKQALTDAQKTIREGTGGLSSEGGQ